MISVPWISSPGALLLWAEVLLAWIVTRYVPVRTGWRCAILVVLTLLAASWIWAAGLLALFAGLFTCGFHLTETRFAAKRMGAEHEILGLVLFAAATAWIIGGTALDVRRTLITLPFGPDRATVICLVAATLLFAVVGGTNIVRGVLDKVGTIPVDTTEYNRGRVIGSLERILLVIAVALEAYTALGFIIAAKGLIRIKEFEKRDFAEYFLIGTLTSVIVALVLGWLLRQAVVNLW